jgi:hypothetical protein
LCHGAKVQKSLEFSNKVRNFAAVIDPKYVFSMEWLEIAAVIILVVIGLFIYRSKTNG